MSETIQFFANGNLGNIAGPATDGVLMGQLTLDDPSKVLLKVAAFSGYCVTDDGGLYVDESIPWGEATADDVEVLPATPAVDDAIYFGHPTDTFDQVVINISTQGAGTWTIVWEYWNGSAWATVPTLTDNTTGFTAVTGWTNVLFTPPSNWARNTVDSLNGYWIRARVSAYTSITTAPQVGQGSLASTGNSTYVDDTTDFIDAGTNDVAALPLIPTAGDGLYIGYATKFCKIRVVTGQARTGTATLTLMYWNGAAWTAVPTVEDDSVGYSATAGAHWIHFTPPSDWAANTAVNGPGGNAGYFVAMELSDLTSVTQQPLITSGKVLPIKTGAEGNPVAEKGIIKRVDMHANTVSGANNDSVFILVNKNQSGVAEFTWTQADAQDSAVIDLPVNAGDELVLVQIIEDGTTEFADANFQFKM